MSKAAGQEWPAYAAAAFSAPLAARTQQYAIAIDPGVSHTGQSSLKVTWLTRMADDTLPLIDLWELSAKPHSQE